MLRMEIALILVLGFVAYIYYSAERTQTALHRTFSALLAAAQDRGLPVIGGLALLHAQAELAFELFVGE